jgi:CTP synthase
LKAAGYSVPTAVSIRWIDSAALEPSNVEAHLHDVDGILVPGGFGGRGTEGKILAAQYAREHRIPFFGICLGMQLATIEFARNVCGFHEAKSTEWDENTPTPIITLMSKQREVVQKGGTMRLGNYPCILTPGTKAYVAYGAEEVNERHRHRYEFNLTYRDVMEAHGFCISGMSPDGKLVEIIELKDHPWFVATQAHPEFKSRPIRPHPLFRDFVQAAYNYHHQ